MDNIIEKSSEQLKNQIEFWFLKYYNKKRTEFTGYEDFTLFDLIEKERQIGLMNMLTLDKTEIPVLILKVSETDFVISTTSKFIWVSTSSIKQISYSDFDGHKGYKSIEVINTPTGKVTDVKTEGMVYEFGLRKRNGDIEYWQIPTGKAGFAFWGVTKKCELIGRKYRIKE